MNYRNLIVRKNPGYLDKNSRENYSPQYRPKTQCPFPFDKMSSGDYFQIPLKNARDPSEVNVLRTTLHQQARVWGIWIKTSINRDYRSEQENKYVMHVIHDGIRK